MNCPSMYCGAIMLITKYQDYDDRYLTEYTCTVCRVIRTIMRAKSDVMGFQLQD